MTDNAKYRILFITPLLAGGGSEMVLLRVANAFAKRGHEVHLILIDNVVDLKPHPSIKLHMAPVPKWLRTKFIREILLARFIKQLDKQLGGFDLILSNFITRRRFLPEALNRKTYYWLHFDYQPYLEILEQNNPKKAKRILQRIRGYYTDKNTIAVSEGAKQSLLHYIGAKPRRIETIYNFFDVEAIREMADVPNPAIPKEPYVILPARFDLIQKRQDKLLALYKQLNLPHKLVLLTKPSDELKQLIESMGLGDRVIVSGFQENPFNWLKQAALTLLYSSHEGFGNVIVESLICGTAVVSTDCPSGPNEILTGELKSNLVPLDEVQSYTLVIQKNLESPLAITSCAFERFAESIVFPKFLALAADSTAADS